MCDDVGIVKQGRLLTQGSVSTMRRRGEALELVPTDLARAAGVLSQIDWVTAVNRDGDRLIVSAPRDRAGEVSKALAQHEIYLSELRPRESSLEAFFLEVTGESSDG